MTNGHISKRTEKRIQRLVNQIFMETTCIGCGERHSIHDMEVDLTTGEYTCEKCWRKREAVGLIAEGRTDAAITQLQHVAAQ